MHKETIMNVLKLAETMMSMTPGAWAELDNDQRFGMLTTLDQGNQLLLDTAEQIVKFLKRRIEMEQTMNDVGWNNDR